jgi:hypothetical protein
MSNTIYSAAALHLSNQLEEAEARLQESERARCRKQDDDASHGDGDAGSYLLLG